MKDFKKVTDISPIMSRPVDYDPPKSVVHKTADNTDEMIKLLQTMIDSAVKESRAQHNRFVVETILSTVAIVIATVAAVASIAPLCPYVASVLEPLGLSLP